MPGPDPGSKPWDEGSESVGQTATLGATAQRNAAAQRARITNHRETLSLTRCVPGLITPKGRKTEEKAMHRTQR